MKRAILLVTVMVVAVVVAFSGVALAQQGRTASDGTLPTAAEKRAGAPVPDRYIVVLNDGENAPAVAAEHARDRGAEVTAVYEHALQGYAARIPSNRLAEVEADPRVRWVESDRTAVAFAQTLPTGINRIEGDLSSTQAGNGSGSVNVAVAVIDTGINKTHPDLNVKGGRNFATWGFPNDNYEDGNGHGTHVSGTIGAKDDGNGVVGVAPGTPLYGVKVLSNSGSGYVSWIVKGIDWVTGRKNEFKDGSTDGDPGVDFRVANMSLGGSSTEGDNCSSSAEHQAICNSTAAGVTYVVAAGNSNADLQGFAPASYNEVLAVTALSDSDGKSGGTGGPPSCRTSEKDDYPATFSNYATLAADQNHTIDAPGVCIYSTWKSSGYNTISGTSMASPHVAGLAALYLANNTATPSQVITKLRADAQTQDTNVGNYGFQGDPTTFPISGHYYGYLAYGGGY